MTESTSTEVAQRTPQQDLVSRVRGDEFKQQIALALPEGVKPERFVRVAVTAVMESPELANADRDSLFKSLIRCAQDGLLPDGREAALPIYKGKVGYIPMIGGFRKIAAEYGWMLRTRVVYANDDFDYSEEPPTITHRAVRPGADRGDLVAAYAVAVHRDGRRLQVVLHPDEIAKRRAMAQTDRVWSEWTPQMWEKTAGRDLFDQLPLAEADRERVQRVLDAAAVEPDEAARLIYGGTATTRPELAAPRPPAETPPVTPSPDRLPSREASPSPRDDATSATSSGEPRQAERAGSGTDGPAPSVPGEVDFTDEPGAETEGFHAPPGATDPEAEARAARAAAAGEMPIPSGNNKGSTIRQVAEQGGKGEAWLLWCLKKWSRDSFRAAVEAYVQVYVPDVWAKYEAWLAEQPAD